MDEPPCPWCLNPIKEDETLQGLFFGRPFLCRDCRPRLKVFSRSIRYEKRKIRIAYASTPGLEELWKQLVRQNDTALAPLFLQIAPREKEWLSRMPCISSKPLEDCQGSRSLDGLGQVFESTGLVLYYPMRTSRGTVDFSEELIRLLENSSFSSSSFYSFCLSFFRSGHSRSRKKDGEAVMTHNKKNRNHKNRRNGYIAVCEDLPSEQDLIYNPVLKNARRIWVLKAEDISWKQSLIQRFVRPLFPALFDQDGGLKRIF